MTDMQIFAHIEDGIVREVLSIPDDIVLGRDLYSSEIAANCIPCDTSVVPGMRYDAGNKAFSPASGQTAPAATQYDFLGFLSLFTPKEQGAIVSSDNGQVRLFCLMAAGASFVDIADQRVIQGTQLLESLGLIGKGRAANVLAGKTAPAA